MKLRNDFKDFNWYNLIHNAAWTTQALLFSTIQNPFVIATHRLGTALSSSIIRIKTDKFCHVPWILFIEIFSMEFMSKDVIFIKFSLHLSLNLSPFSNVIKVTITGKIFPDESLPTGHNERNMECWCNPKTIQCSDYQSNACIHISIYP